MEDYVTRTKVTISRAEQWTMYSKTENRPYEIFVAKPKEPAPPSGYPVIYVLDGNAFFQTFQEVVRVQSVRSEKTGVKPAVIVGIGYPVEEDFASAYRFYDFTPQSSSLNLPPRPGGNPWPKTGGADLFFHFIQEELKPHINKQFHIDSKQQTIFGHSLGGLFTLYALFTNPNAFQKYIASSPSIWWNNQCILERESQFISRLHEKNIDASLFLAVGSLEKDFMIADAKALSKRLLHVADSRLQIEFNELDGENHVSVVPTVLSRTLRFISSNSCTNEL